MILTADSVSAALARPPETGEDGRMACQVCDRWFAGRGALGPHQLTHRRAVGLAPSRAEVVTYGGLGTGVVRCAMEGCTARIRRPGYRAHLKNVHRLSPESAATVMRNQAGEAKTSVAVVQEPDPGGPDPLMTDLSAVDAAAGILNAARRDGLIPVGMLRPVIDWIGHTDRLLAELARQSGEARR